MSLTVTAILIWGAKTVAGKAVVYAGKKAYESVASYFLKDFQKAIAIVSEGRPELKDLAVDLTTWWSSGELAKLILELNEPNKQKLIPQLVAGFDVWSGHGRNENEETKLEFFSSVLSEFEVISRSKHPDYAARKSVEADERLDEISLQMEKMQGKMYSLDQARNTQFDNPIDDPAFAAFFQKFQNEQAVKEIGQRIDTGDELFRANELSAALQVYEGLRTELDKKPTFDGKLLLEFRLAASLFECDLRLEKFDDAKVEVERALKIQPDNATALANSAHLDYVQFKNLKVATKLATRAVAISPGSKYVVAVYVTCVGLTEGITVVARTLKDIDRSIVLSAPLQLALGELRHARGEFSKAIGHYRRCIQSKPNDPISHYMLAQTLYQAGRQKVIKLTNQGVLATDADKAQLTEAVEEVSTAIRLSENSNDRVFKRRAYEMRSATYLVIQLHSEGLSDCDAADLFGGGKQTDRLRGAHLALSGNFERAVPILLKSLDPSRPDVTQALAYSYYRLHKFPEANRLFVQYVDEDGTSEELRMYIQSLWLEGTEYTKKRASQLASGLRRRGVLVPMFMEGIELRRLTEQQDWHVAILVLKDLIKVDPTDSHYHVNLMAMYVNTRQQYEAVKIYNRLRNGFHGPPEAQEMFRGMELDMHSRGWI